MLSIEALMSTGLRAMHANALRAKFVGRASCLGTGLAGASKTAPSYCRDYVAGTVPPVAWAPRESKPPRACWTTPLPELRPTAPPLTSAPRARKQGRHRASQQIHLAAEPPCCAGLEKAERKAV